MHTQVYESSDMAKVNKVGLLSGPLTFLGFWVTISNFSWLKTTTKLQLSFLAHKKFYESSDRNKYLCVKALNCLWFANYCRPNPHQTKCFHTSYESQNEIVHMQFLNTMYLSKVESLKLGICILNLHFLFPFTIACHAYLLLDIQ